jgi:hypothetical protein
MLGGCYFSWRMPLPQWCNSIRKTARNSCRTPPANIEWNTSGHSLFRILISTSDRFNIRLNYTRLMLFILLIMIWIWGSHSSGYEDFSLLGQNAVQSSESHPTCRDNISLPYWVLKSKPSKKSARSRASTAWLPLRAWRWRWYAPPKL